MVSPGSSRALSSSGIHICVYRLPNRLLWKQDKERRVSVGRLLAVVSKPGSGTAGPQLLEMAEHCGGLARALPGVQPRLPSRVSNDFILSSSIKLYKIWCFFWVACLETQHTDLLKTTTAAQRGRPLLLRSPRVRRGFSAGAHTRPHAASEAGTGLQLKRSPCVHTETRVSSWLHGHPSGLPLLHAGQQGSPYTI